MLLRINNEFISVPEDVEIEKQANLFQDITEIDGDFSYSFSIPNTVKTRATLGIKSIHQSDKLIYEKIDCQLLSNTGQVLYVGFIRVENIAKTIDCSFFSGNSNWIDTLDKPLIEIDLSAYNATKSGSTIITSWTATSGVVFPLMDTGLLGQRVQSFNLETEDFHPCIYVKNVIQTILNRAGLKLIGDITQDKLYNNLVMTSKSKSATETLISNRSTNAGKTSSQGMDDTLQKVTFTDDSTSPYYDGNKNNYSTVNSRYTADVAMWVKVDVFFKLASAKDWFCYILKNGAAYTNPVRYPSGGIYSNPAALAGVSANTVKLTYGGEVYDQQAFIELNAGDYIETHFQLATPLDTVNILSGGYFRITPVKFITVLPESIMPNITQAEFVAGIFSLFNPVVEFDPYSKTIDVNFFKNIRNRPAQDWSKYIIPSTVEENFTDFIQDYAKKNYFNYEEGENEDVKQYNKQNETCYGCGKIEINNFYLEGRKDISFPFASVPADFSQVVGGYIPKFKFLSTEDFGDASTISSVASGTSGAARFTTSAAHGFSVGDWVIITSSTVAGYIGHGKISQVPTTVTFEIFKLRYTSNATGSVLPTNIIDEDDDNLYLMVNLPNYSLTDFSGNENLAIEGSNNTRFAYSYFDKPVTNLDLDYIRQVMAFEPLVRQGYNGIGLLQTYFREFENVLNDPVMLPAEFNLPVAEFLNFRFKYPVRINTPKYTGLFYVNKIRGYKGSNVRCLIELIKL